MDSHALNSQTAQDIWDSTNSAIGANSFLNIDPVILDRFSVEQFY